MYHQRVSVGLELRIFWLVLKTVSVRKNGHFSQKIVDFNQNMITPMSNGQNRLNSTRLVIGKKFTAKEINNEK